MGLEAIHKMGYMHRDIKSLNIFLTKDLVAKVADFGMVTNEATASDACGTPQVCVCVCVCVCVYYKYMHILYTSVVCCDIFIYYSYIICVKAQAFFLLSSFFKESHSYAQIYADADRHKCV